MPTAKPFLSHSRVPGIEDLGMKTQAESPSKFKII